MSPGTCVAHHFPRSVAVGQRQHKLLCERAKLLVSFCRGHQVALFRRVVESDSRIRELYLCRLSVQLANVKGFEVRGIAIMRQVVREASHLFDVSAWLFLKHELFGCN